MKQRLAKLIDTFRHTYQSIEKDYTYEFAGITEAITSLYNQGKNFSWCLVRRVMY